MLAKNLSLYDNTVSPLIASQLIRLSKIKKEIIEDSTEEEEEEENETIKMPKPYEIKNDPLYQTKAPGLISVIQQVKQMTTGYKKLRDALLKNKKELGITLEKQGCFTAFKVLDEKKNKKKTLKGIHNALAEYVFPLNVSVHPRQSGFFHGSSMEEGRQIDSIRQHILDCYMNTLCSCDRSYRYIKHESVNMLSNYYRDAALLGMVPLTTQLYCFDRTTNVATAADEVFYRPKHKDLVVVECKMGYRGPVNDYISPSCKYIRRGPFQKTPSIKHTWINRHTIQAALTALMIEENYCTENLPLGGVYVCYFQRSNIDPEKTLNLMWTNVFECEWFDGPEKRKKLYESWRETVQAAHPVTKIKKEDESSTVEKKPIKKKKKEIVETTYDDFLEKETEYSVYALDQATESDDEYSKKAKEYIKNNKSRNKRKYSDEEDDEDTGARLQKKTKRSKYYEEKKINEFIWVDYE